MSEYELVKKLGSYDNFKGLKLMAKVPWHKLFARNKLSAPTVECPTQAVGWCGHAAYAAHPLASVRHRS